MSVSIMDIVIRDLVDKEEQERTDERRPRVSVPQPPPDYLRYIEDKEKKEGAEKEDNGRGVTVFQM